MPKNVQDTIWLIVEIERFHCFRMAGAAKAKVYKSPSSKKNTIPNIHIARWWIEVIGKRSRRAANDSGVDVDMVIILSVKSGVSVSFRTKGFHVSSGAASSDLADD